MDRLIPPLIGAASLALALRARFGDCGRSRPPARTYQLCMTSVRLSMRSSASCLSLALSRPLQWRSQPCQLPRVRRRPAVPRL